MDPITPFGLLIVFANVVILISCGAAALRYANAQLFTPVRRRGARVRVGGAFLSLYLLFMLIIVENDIVLQHCRLYPA